MINRPQIIATIGLLLFALSALPARAGIFNLDLDTDPSAVGVQFFGAAEHRTTGGVGNSGYLKITDAVNGARGAIVFPDLDEGADVVSFSITADLRVGGGTARPADGFSFNLARPGDPVLDDGEDWAASPTGEANLPEEGTTTGLAIGFDEWFSGGTDAVGMSVRIDDVIVSEIDLPTLNGELADTTSLQTGPLGPGGEGDDSQLGWATLGIDLFPDGRLLIGYKGLTVFDEVVDYVPSPGILVFGGRTGGANSNHHIDNIFLNTNTGTPEPGDTNGDGVADIQDYEAIRDNLYTGKTLEEGDVNFDRQVNLDDFFVWRTAFEAAGAAPTPEPTSGVILLLGLLTMSLARRPKRL